MIAVERHDASAMQDPATFRKSLPGLMKFSAPHFVSLLDAFPYCALLQVRRYKIIHSRNSYETFLLPVDYRTSVIWNCKVRGVMVTVSYYGAFAE